MIHFTNINGERLPEDVNKIANQRWNGTTLTLKDGNMDLSFMCLWEYTPENTSIWDEVYQGNYEPLRKFHNL